MPFRFLVGGIVANDCSRFEDQLSRIMSVIPYQIKNRKLYTDRYCELNVVYRCNLSCRGCSHLSPTMSRSRYTVDPDQVFQDFSQLAKHYAPRGVKLVGGEPLLHPNLEQVVNAIHESGITKFVKIVTNGQLLLKVPDRLWEQVNAIEVSIYPGKDFSPQVWKEISCKAKATGTLLEHYCWDDFRESYSEIGTPDSTLIERIYKTCAIAHVWRCHTVDRGYFYKCPQSVFLTQMLQDSSLENDGLKIEDADAQALLKYLTAKAPLASCAHCLGCVGKRFVHEQVRPAQWRSTQNVPTEVLLDAQYLELLEKKLNRARSCTREMSPIERVKRKVTAILHNYQR